MTPRYKHSRLLNRKSIIALGAADANDRRSLPSDFRISALDMYAPSTKQLVWTGNATKTIDPSSNQEKNQKNLDRVMQKLLKNYPPKRK